MILEVANIGRFGSDKCIQMYSLLYMYINIYIYYYISLFLYYYYYCIYI